MKQLIRYLLLSGLGAIVFNAPAQSILDREPNHGELIYRCEPCGCQHDDVVFGEPGSCPSCNMTLNARLHGYETIRRQSLSVGILLFDGADIMDVTGPWSVFAHARLSVSTVAKTKDDVQLGGGLVLTPDYGLEDFPKVDVLVIPGGGPAESNQDPEIVSWLKTQRDSVETMFSVCSGAFLLAKAGILDGQQATTFASLIPQFEQEFPKVKVVRDTKYTNNGNVFTSAGLSSGIEASYQLLAEYYGQGFAQNVANHMEFDWDIKSDYARTQLADNYLLSLQSIVGLFAQEFNYSYGGNNHWEYRFKLRSGIDKAQFLSTLKEELKGQVDWTATSSKELTGRIDHKLLGPGIIRIQASSKGENPTITIEANRIIQSSSHDE